MRILHVIYSLSSGGGERFVVNLCNELSRLGQDVTLLTIRDISINGWGFNRQFLLPEVKIKSLCVSQGRFFLGLIRASRFMQDNRFDVVNFHLNVVPFFFLSIFFNKRTFYFHTLHNLAQYAIPVHGRFIYHFLYKWNYVFPIAISNECANSLIRFFPFLKTVKHINNGAIAPVSTDQYGSIVNIINSLKINPKTKVLLHVARFSTQKRQDILFQAVNELVDEGLNIVLCVIGDGYDTDDAKQLLQKYHHNIHILGLKNNPGDYMRASDAFCLSSDYEGLPISLLEAIGCGCVPICTPVGGILNVVTDGITGYLAKDVSVQGMKEAIKRYLLSSDAIKSDELKTYFEKNYTMKQCAEQYLDFYQEHSIQSEQ